MIMNDDFLPLSPSEISMFLDCPAKFWYKKNKDIEPLPQQTNEYMTLGLNSHTIIANYYHELQKKPKFSPDDIHKTLKKSIAKSEHIIDDIRKYTHHFRKFEKFEEDRLTWSHFKPLLVEKYLKNKLYKGIADVIYLDNQGQRVIVDWKTGAIKDWHILQGYVYKQLAQAGRVIFFYTLKGKKVELTNNQLNKAKEEISKIMTQMSNGENTRRERVHCRYCEYSLACRINKLKLEEV